MASNAFHSSISKIDIIDNVSDKYHTPINMYVHIDCIAHGTARTSNGSANVIWNCMTDDQTFH